MTRRTPHLALPLVAVLAALLAGCGSATPTPAAAPPRSTPSTEPVAAEAPATDPLIACLTGAGLHAAVGDSTPAGVSDPVAEVDVTGMADFEGGTDQGATLWVFADAATATADAGVITLGVSDDPSNTRAGVHGSVVRDMRMVLASPPTADEQALLDCLPPAPAPSPSTAAAATLASLDACFTAAGLTTQAGDADDLPWLGTIDVYSMDAYGQAAEVYVFADADTAHAHLEDVFLEGPSDDPHHLVRGDTATVLNQPLQEDQPDTAAFLGCLPAPS